MYVVYAGRDVDPNCEKPLHSESYSLKSGFCTKVPLENYYILEEIVPDLNSHAWQAAIAKKQVGGPAVDSDSGGAFQDSDSYLTSGGKNMYGFTTAAVVLSSTMLMTF